MSLILFLIIGGLVGWAASMITGNNGQGVVMDVVIGIVGSFLAGTVMEFIRTGNLDFVSTINGFHIESILISIIGAVALMFIVKAFKSKTA